MHRLGKLIPCALAVLAAAVGAARAQTVTVQELARMSNDSAFSLRGLGLVVGLPGTGDSGKEPAMARPLARVLEASGNPVPDIEELAKTKSVALVMVTCQVPRGGARLNDELDVTVSTLGTATSLEGGQLFITPLQGPLRGSPVYAWAEGPVDLLDTAIATTVRVQGGAKIAKELVLPPPDSHFTLVVEEQYRGYGSTSQIATAINDEYFATPAAEGLRIAKALDDRTIAVDIPEGERADTAPFIGGVMSTPVAVELLRLPAQVICDTRRGVISFTGDVRISDVAITARGISIVSTIPAPVPTPADPLVTQSAWMGLSTNDPNSPGRAKLQDLLNAFSQLNVPVEDQIAVIEQIHAQGQLHAKLIVR